MVLAAIVIVVAFTTLLTLFVRAKDIPPPDPVSPTQHLDERKAAIYENLRDLQFEYRVGKLSDGDYQQTKLKLQMELATVLAEIDHITQQTPAKPATQKPRRAGGIICPHCGAQFASAMKFCGECGKAMS